MLSIYFVSPIAMLARTQFRVRLAFSPAGLGLPLEMAESEIPPLPSLSQRFLSATTKQLIAHLLQVMIIAVLRGRGEQRSGFSLKAEPLSRQPRASGATAAL